jgi:hypothetical protein
MNINDYTYHLCDRFILLFVAFVGLMGTSYILVNANNNREGQIKSYSLGIQQTTSKKTIDKYTVTLSAAAPEIVVSEPSAEEQEKSLAKSQIDLQSIEYNEIASNPN